MCSIIKVDKFEFLDEYYKNGIITINKTSFFFITFGFKRHGSAM